MATKTAFVKQLRGITFVGKTDTNHWITMDGPENFYGSNSGTVSYTHLRAHETVLDLVCRLLLEKKKKKNRNTLNTIAHTTHT